MRRVPTSIRMKTYTCRNLAVTATRKSQATRVRASFTESFMGARRRRDDYDCRRGDRTRWPAADLPKEERRHAWLEVGIPRGKGGGRGNCGSCAGARTSGR